MSLFYIKTMEKDRKSEITILTLVLTSLALTIYFFHLWDYDFRIPLLYSDGDYLFNNILVKRLMNYQDVYMTNQMGAPLSATNIDFPLFGETLNLILLKVFAIVFDNYGVGINLFFVLSFPLSSFICYLVMKELKVKQLFAFFGALTFTFLPYKFIRNVGHLFLSMYTWIPAVTLILIWFILDDNLFTFNKFFFKHKRNIVVCVTLIVVSLTGIYYAFFTGFFIAVALLIKMLQKVDYKTLFKAALMYTLLIVPLLISALPAYIMKCRIGTNPEGPIRSPLEAEVYAMKITQLFIPNQTHQIPILEKLISAYSNAPLNNEGSEYLGFMGILGFIFLILVLFTNLKIFHSNEIQILSKFNIAALLLAVIGGFGSLFSIIVSPQIRAYNRISVFIAFFSILTFCLVITHLNEKYKFSKLLLILIIFILSLGLVEQSFVNKDGYGYYTASFYSDKKFVKNIEKQVSKNAMIYQLPYHPFPESGSRNKMGDYALARGFLHSDNLRWSYGDQKGRDSDLLHRSLAQYSISELINKITFLGFEGIYIDTWAYTDEEMNTLRNQIESIIGIAPLISDDKRLLFYNLKDYIINTSVKYSKEEWNRNALVFTYTNGFSEYEGNIEKNWRWCNKSGDILIYSFSDTQMELSFSAKAFTGYEECADLIVKSNEFIQTIKINSMGSEICFSIPIKEGKNKISFVTNAEKVIAPGDSRELVMRFDNISFCIK